MMNLYKEAHPSYRNGLAVKMNSPYIPHPKRNSLPIGNYINNTNISIPNKEE